MSDSQIVPDSWALADEAQSRALGLPDRPGGWGLLMFEAEGARWTLAGDRALIAAIEEREGALEGWETRLGLRAEGWPEADSEGMTWRRLA